MGDREQFWQTHVDACRVGGVSQKTYCERHGITPKTFRKWRARLAGAAPLVAADREPHGGEAKGGARELFSPSFDGLSDRAQLVDLLTNPRFRRTWTPEQRQQIVIDALRSGMSIERFARMPSSDLAAKRPALQERSIASDFPSTHASNIVLSAENPTMRIDFMPGTGNVVRFPAERRARPTLSLLREIAPDPRQVGLAADLHGIPHPVAGLRDDADAATAGHIRDHILPGPGDTRQAALRALLEPQLAQAVAACWDARDALAAAGDAWRAIERAQAAGSPHAEAMEQEAAELSRHAAELAVQADLCSQEVEGVARAVRVAERGGAWMPADRDAEFAESFGLAQPV